MIDLYFPASLINLVRVPVVNSYAMQTYIFLLLGARSSRPHFNYIHKASETLALPGGTTINKDFLSDRKEFLDIPFDSAKKDKIHVGH